MPEHEVFALSHHLLPVAQSILAIQLQAYSAEALLLGIEHFPPLERVVEEIQGSHETFIGAYQREDLIGAASYGKSIDDREIEVGSLVVDPKWHRRRVGTKLLEEILRMNKGFSVIVATGLKNSPAVSLYSKLGFVEYGREIKPRESIEIIRLRKSAA